MFNVGPSEVIVIALVLLIAVGPEQLPGVIRRAGRVASQVRSMTEGLRADFMAGMDEIERATDPESWAGSPQSSPIDSNTAAAAKADTTSNSNVDTADTSSENNGSDESDSDSDSDSDSGGDPGSGPEDESSDTAQDHSGDDAAAVPDNGSDSGSDNRSDNGSKSGDDRPKVDPLSAALITEDDGGDDAPVEPRELPPDYSHVAAANAWPPKNASAEEPAADGTPTAEGERGDSA